MPLPSTKKPDVSIIVVSYNTCQLTVDAIASIEQETALPYQVIVVDNASTDRSAEAIHAGYPSAIVVQNPTNEGFARACNRGADLAEANLILLLNSDTRVLSAAIDKLVAFARQNPEAGMWTGQSLLLDGSIDPSSCWHHMTLWSVICEASGLRGIFPASRAFNPETYPRWQRDAVRNVDAISGCFFLVDRKLWNDLNGFDPAFFMYGEEFDFCRRARKRGKLPLFTPSAAITHVGGASSSNDTTPTIQIIAARMRTVRKHFSVVQVNLATACMRSGIVARYLTFSVLNKLSGRFKSQAAKWQEVMANKSTWWNGYEDFRPPVIPKN